MEATQGRFGLFVFSDENIKDENPLLVLNFFRKWLNQN